MWLEYVGEGAWSRCVGFEHDGQQLVVRFGRHRDDFVRDRHAARWSGSGLPVPAVLQLGDAFGGWFIVSERRHGRPIETGTANEWRAARPALLRLFEGLRTADIGDSTGYGELDESGNAQHLTWRDALMACTVDSPRRRTFGWSERLLDAPGARTLFDEGARQMAALAGALPSGERSLVHSDLVNRNVLIDGLDITAVFDWGCSL